MAYIKLSFGPCESNGIIKYKSPRLRGVLNRITELGYDIEIVRSPHIDRLTIEMCGKEVFRCSLNSLLFNMGCEEDVVCKRLTDSLEEARSRMVNDDNIPKFTAIEKGKRHLLVVRAGKTEELLSSDIKLLYEINKMPESSSSNTEDNLSDDW